MAGKKGRSGRKPKNKKPVHFEPVKIESAAPVEGLNASVDNTQADPFRAIEAQLENELPQAQADNPQIIRPGEEKQPPERIIRLAWGWIYKAEDNVLRGSLGLGAEYKGIFCDEKLIEAHVLPTCEVVKQYVPAEYWADLDKKFPVAALIAAIGEAQLSVFDKIGEIKRDLKLKNSAGRPQAPQSTPKPSADPYSDFPRPGA